MKSIFFLIITFIGSITLSFPSGINPESRFNNIKFELLSTENGLSSSVIYALNQDNKGYLWIGTGEGLNRFDGYEFRVFKHEPFDSTTISDNWILNIETDSRGTLWVGTHNGGLNKFVPETNSFIRYRFINNDESSIASDRVWHVTEDKPGYLWVSTSGGLCYFDIDNEKFTRFAHEDNIQGSLPSNSVNYVFKDSKNSFWVGTFGAGLTKIVNENNTTSFVYPEVKSGDHLLNSTMIKVMVEDIHGNIWLGTYRNGLLRYNPANKTVVQFMNVPGNNKSLSENSVFGLAFDSDNNLWIGTHDEGLCILPANFLNSEEIPVNEFARIKNNPLDPGSLSNNSAIALMKDTNGLMWIGTDNGVNKYNPFRAKFITLGFDDLSPERSTGSFIKSIHRSLNGDLWIGTYNDGLYKMDSGLGETLRYTSSRDKNSLSNNTVWAIIEPVPGEFWLGTAYGLNYFNSKTGMFTTYVKTQSSASLSHNNISALHDLDAKYMLIGTWGGGINIFDKQTGAFLRYVHNYDDDHSLSSNVIKSFFVDSQGNLWVGTFGGGLNLISAADLENTLPGELKFRRFRHEPGNRKSISSDNITFLTETSDGVLWCGTFGGGLNRITVSKDINGLISEVDFRAYLEPDGLPDNTIFNLLTDSRDNLWLSTNKGLAKFVTSSGIFFNYDKKDGLQDNEFDQGAFKDQDGNLIFGGVAGINIFDPDDLRKTDKQAPLVFTSVKKFSPGTGTEQEVDLLKDIIIDYSDYYFTIEFSALDLTRPEKNLYAYKLDGFDEDWIYSGNRRSVRYTNLDGGEYTFLIKGTDSEGVWNEEPAKLSLYVTSPPWLRWWAVSIYGILFVGIMLALMRFSGREQRRELRLRQRELEMERNISKKLRYEEKLKESIFQISEAVSESAKFEDLFTKVHEIIKSLIHARNFYIALYNSKNQTIEFPYYIDEKEKLPTKSVEPQKLGNSLTEYLIRKGEALLISDKEFEKLVKMGEVDLIGSPSKEWLGVPLKDSTGEIIGALVVQNYTDELVYTEKEREILSFVSNQIGVAIERKQNEEVKNKYDFIVNTSRAFMTMIDRDYNYVAVNKRFCTHHGKAREEIIGNPVSQIWGDYEFKNTIKGYLDKAFTGELVSYQAWFEAGNKELRCFEVEYYPYRDEQNEITHVVVVTKDVTKLVVAEADVRKLLRAVEQAGEVIFMTNLEGVFTYANPAFEQVYGYKVEEIIGENPRILRSGKTDAAFYKKMWGTILDGKPFRAEILNKTQNDTLIEIELSINPIYDTNNHIMGFISVQSDISLRKETERKLVEAKELAEKTARLKSEFLSQMSHEVRTPLNSIINMTELLEDELSDVQNQSVSENLEFLKLSARRILRTVHMILDLSEVQSGLVNPNDQIFDICSLFDEVAGEMKSSTHGKKLDFLISKNVGNCEINSDKYWIEQIFSNLIDNAIKFTDSGSIKVTLNELNGKILFSVQDTGAGISQEYLSEIFEPFTQEKKGYSREYEGNGIGLSLVKRYCDLLGATIEVESVKEKGSTFSVMLPR